MANEEPGSVGGHSWDELALDWPFAPAPAEGRQPLGQPARQVGPSGERADARTSRERISEWWEGAYIVGQDGLNRDRFFGEAAAALPIRADDPPQADDVLDGMELRRELLRQDQTLEEWTIS